MSAEPGTSDLQRKLEESAKGTGGEDCTRDLNEVKNDQEGIKSERDSKFVPEKNAEKLVTTKKNTAVNFQDTCELYEIDLENGTRKKEIKLKPPAFKSVRYYVMILALISPFVTTYSRTIINFAIIDMIDPEYIEKKADGQQVELNTTKQYFDRDNSCPVDDSIRARLIEENKQDIQRASSGSGEKYPWDTFKQGLLKGAYAIGHAPLQIPGSRLSEMYGSHRVLSGSALLIAVCCFGAPYLAALHFYLLFIDLILLGILGSFMTPALITLFSNWLTPSEKSIMISFYLVASRLGYAFSSLLCGLLIQAQFSWRYVFITAGWISLAYCTSFFLLARSTPRDHPLSSKLELDYLASKNTLVRESLAARESKTKYENQSELEIVGASKQSKVDSEHKKNTKKGAPWVAILTNVPVWTFIITKFCVKLAGDTVQIELPVYWKNVMHFSAKDNGIFNAWNYVIFCGSCLFAGSLAKYVVKKRPFGLGKTAIRKCFQCFASFSVAISLIGIAFSVCNYTFTQFWLFVLFFTTSFGIGGEAQAPLDITERYPGTIHAIGSSLAISGAIEPTLVGFLIRGHAADRDVWKRVWLGASAISFIGGLVFLIFADATIQPFDSIRSETSAEEGNEKDLTGSDNKAYVKDSDVVKQREGGPSEEQDEKPYRESVQI